MVGSTTATGICSRPLAGSADETDDPDVRRLFGVANSLHVNFYEGWMDTETVTAGIEDVKLLLHKLETLEVVST